jgi:c-di-GMP-binding flagellar brake protein YcgR
MPLEERRQFFRLSVLADVKYDKREVPDEIRLSLTKNISGGGICLIIYEDFKQGDILDLKIYLPEENTPINAVGRIVWLKEFTIGEGEDSSKRFDSGIEFVDISPEGKEKIEKYVFSHL